MSKPFYGKDFFEECAPQITKEVQGKVVKGVVIDRSGMDDLLKILFEEETTLVFRYDWIYEWDVINEQELTK